MKKSILIILVLLLLLTACQNVPDSEQDPAGSTPSSSSSTPPSSSAVPNTSAPATSIPATSAPVVDVHDGRAFVTYYEPSVELSPDWVPPSDCLVDHLYWVIRSTKECILICDEPIYSRSYTTTDTHVYFVKESEPTKIYRTPIGDFANHQLFYESAYGKVNYMVILDYYTTGIENYLQFVADEKKFVLFDMTTGKSTIFMEQYYIDSAIIGSAYDGSIFENNIMFFGKPTEDAPQGDYFYYWQTGEIELDTRL